MATEAVVSRILKAPYDILTSMADITDEGTANTTYMGFIKQTSNEDGKTNTQLKGAECWLIIKIVVDGDVTYKYFAEGSTAHDKEWDERASYNYYFKR